MRLQNAWLNPETGGSGLLDPEASSHPLWPVTVSRTKYFVKLLCASRLAWEATAAELRTMRCMIRPAMLLGDELAHVLYWDLGTCSTTNANAALDDDVCELVSRGTSTWEGMDSITQEGVHPKHKECLLFQACSGRPGALSALGEQVFKQLAEFHSAESDSRLNCAQSKEKAKARREARRRRVLKLSNGMIPVSGCLDLRPHDRPEPRGLWKDTPSWIGREELESNGSGGAGGGQVSSDEETESEDELLGEHISDDDNSGLDEEGGGDDGISERGGSDDDQEEDDADDDDKDDDILNVYRCAQCLLSP